MKTFQIFFGCSRSFPAQNHNSFNIICTSRRTKHCVHVTPEFLALGSFSWCPRDGSSSRSCIISQILFNYPVNGPVTVLIWWATSLDVMDFLEVTSITWSDILLGVFENKFSAYVLLSMSSVSVLTVFFKRHVEKRGWCSKCWRFVLYESQDRLFTECEIFELEILLRMFVKRECLRRMHKLPVAGCCRFSGWRVFPE